jgi:hypothetical protein
VYFHCLFQGARPLNGIPARTLWLTKSFTPIKSTWPISAKTIQPRPRLNPGRKHLNLLVTPSQRTGNNMHTNCKSCKAPIAVHTDRPTAPYQCEACETVTCKCGSSVFTVQRTFTARKLVCTVCDNLIDADFTSAEIGLSFEALQALGLK